MALINAAGSFLNVGGTYVGPVTSADTFGDIHWPGGEGTVFLEGTPGSATVNVTFAATSTATKVVMDSNAAPTGSVFTNTAGHFNFSAAEGFISATASGGGGTQSLTLRVKPRSPNNRG